MDTKKFIHIIGYASGIAAGDIGCSDGPLGLRNNQCFANVPQLQCHWHDLLTTKPTTDPALKLKQVAQLCEQLARQTATIYSKRDTFLVLGGDHSCAIGTWSGVHQALAGRGPLGLIWVDAHLDSHTFETTESGNIHGMPLASLLGYGDPLLTHMLNPIPKILPQHICIVGARSFEQGELELIQRLGVRVFYMDEIHQRGIEAVLQDALAVATNGTVTYGISLDLDAIDPLDAPGVGSAEAGGISGAALCDAMKIFHGDKRLAGMELVEYNPHHDHHNKTQDLIIKLTSAIMIGK